jgi:Spy/CpxP family protein refolding chaperone
MKRNKSTLMTVAVLGSLMAFGPIDSVRADDANPPASGTNSVAGKGGARGEKMKELIEKLNLTPEQKPQFMSALKSQREQMKALQEDASLDTDAKRAKRKEIMEATAAKLKTFLTADQLAQWEAGIKQMRPGGEGAHGSGGGTKPLPTSPTP